MKKVVVIVLMLMPFVLTIMISLMGKIISLSTYIKVEKVCFINEIEEELPDYLVLEKGDSLDLLVKVYPELASDKRYEYSMSEEYNAICSLDANGKVTGLSQGTVEIFVKSLDNLRKGDKIVIRVTQSKVESISLNIQDVELSVGDSYKLIANVLPTSSVNKYVTWTSSDSNVVTVSNSGEVFVKTYLSTPITITATSVSSPSVTATCVIRISEKTQPTLIFTPRLTGNNIYQFESETLDLKSILTYDDTVVNIDQVQFEILTNASDAGATLIGSVLTVTEEMQIFKMEASFGSYKTSIFLMRYTKK